MTDRPDTIFGTMNNDVLAGFDPAFRCENWLERTTIRGRPYCCVEVADHINEIITDGTANQRKILIEALIPQIKITEPGWLLPVFRIPSLVVRVFDSQARHRRAAVPTDHSEYRGQHHRGRTVFVTTFLLPVCWELRLHLACAAGRLIPWALT